MLQIGDFAIDKPAVFWINDGLMALFFFAVGLEIKREFMRGHLRHREQVMLPAVATIGGILAPALLYAVMNRHDPVALHGWAIPAATDIAFAMAALSLMGNRIATGLKVFLLSIAIFDDLGAILIIALFYSEQLSMLSLSIAGAGLVILVLLNHFSVRYQSFYVIVGLIFWAAVLKSGIHATLAGFLVALFIPQRLYNPMGRLMADHLERSLHPWVTFLILPLFAFGNAGVSFNGDSGSQLITPVSLGIFVGLFAGKQFGIFGASWLAIKLGAARLPTGVSWAQLYGASLLCGIGFTMSLFIGLLSFEHADPAYLDQVKVGVLMGSIASAVAGILVLYKSHSRTTKQPISDNHAYCHWLPGRKSI